MKEPREVYKGLAQGSILSPLEYPIYVKSLENLGPRMKISQFADDVLVYIITDDPENDKILLEEAIQRVQADLTILGLKLAANKTEFVDYNENFVQPGEIRLRINENLIPSEAFAKFLGGFLDYEMSFHKHINTVVKKCNRSNNII